MSDIVERLRNWNHGIPKTMIVSEAADEIERLRRHLADCQYEKEIIRAATIEECAKVADNVETFGWTYRVIANEIAAAIRALKEQK